MNFASSPDAARPAKAANCNHVAPRRARVWIMCQAKEHLSDTEWAILAALESIIGGFSLALRRIARCHRSLHISTPLRRACMKCGITSVVVAWRRSVSSLNWRIALTSSLDVGVLDGDTGPFRRGAPGVCESAPAVRASSYPGCVYWRSSGKWRAGTRTGIAGGHRVLNGFALIP